jgi:hypothetical protein
VSRSGYIGFIPLLWGLFMFIVRNKLAQELFDFNKKNKFINWYDVDGYRIMISLLSVFFIIFGVSLISGVLTV